MKKLAIIASISLFAGCAVPNKAPSLVNTAAIDGSIQRAVTANDAASKSASAVHADLTAAGSAIGKAETATEQADAKATVVTEWLKSNP